jgi:hypothetical protein
MKFCKITFSDDDRRFTSLEMSKSMWAQNVQMLCNLKKRMLTQYILLQFCSDKKPLQEPAPLTFPQISFGKISKPVLINPYS